MKVLVVNWRDIYNPEAGGAEIHIDEILKRKPSSWNVDFVSALFKNANPYDQTPFYKIHRIHDNALFNFKFRFYYKKYLSLKNYDLIIDDISKIPLAIPSYVKNIPVISVIHHIHGNSLFKELPYPLALYVSRMEKFFLRYYISEPVIAVSESTKNELLRLYPYKNITVSNNGIDYDSLNRCFKKDSEKPPVLLYLGRLKKYKRVDHIIRAFAIVKNKISGAKLLIAGKGDDEERLRGISEGLGLDQSVNFLGFIDDKDKNPVFSRSKIYVIASEKEGWGISVLEANAAGLPAIGYDVEGLRDSIKDGFSGFLVKNNDIGLFAAKILQVLGDGDLASKLSFQANAWAKGFSWDSMAENFYRIIRDKHGLLF